VVGFHGRFISRALNFLFLRATLLAWDDILELICCDLALPAAFKLRGLEATSRRLRSAFHFANGSKMALAESRLEPGRSSRERVSRMKICLVVAEGTQAGTEVPITKFPFIIGRAPSCQLRPASEIISKQHCAFLVHKGKAYLRDLGSRNGTLINGKRVQKTVALRDRDILAIGPLAFMVRVTDDVSVNQPTPLPPNRDSDPDMEPPGEEEVAALLLEMDAQEPPEEDTSSTLIELPKADGPREVLKAPDRKAKPKENSSVAAQDLIKKLLRGGKA
jgi:hypothetical protein